MCGWQHGVEWLQKKRHLPFEQAPSLPSIRSGIRDTPPRQSVLTLPPIFEHPGAKTDHKHLDMHSPLDHFWGQDRPRVTPQSENDPAGGRLPTYGRKSIMRKSVIEEALADAGWTELS